MITFFIIAYLFFGWWIWFRTTCLKHGPGSLSGALVYLITLLVIGPLLLVGVFVFEKVTNTMLFGYEYLDRKTGKSKFRLQAVPKEENPN